MKAFFVIAALLPCALPAMAAPVDYARDVLPILSDKCYHCHGPDEKGRKAKLRLDTREGAFAARKDGTTIIAPRKSSDSELIRRITTTNPDDQMPPPDSNRSLTREQIQLLTRWMDEGANWGTHWSFIAPVRPAPPQVTKGWRTENAIDAFILARLKQEGLSPAPPASKETLLRRVTLDLTGLPPTLKELSDFLEDRSPNAYEKVVDRLLASPAYGERLATEWLDLARYADTHGYQMDRFRPMWPYRDWVINAFNRNLPFNDFVKWQIAGDLLPGATKEQRLATAFNRLHNQNEEGGIVEEEYRVAYVVDRVNTFGTAFLGLTTECSRCHDHKYDPLSQRDFYSLFAFFQNIDEAGQTSYFTDSMPVPALLLSTDKQDEETGALQKRITEKEKELSKAREDAREGFSIWLKSVTREARGPAGHFTFDEIVSNKVVNVASPTNFAKAQEGPQLVDGKHGKGVQLSGENGFVFPGLGHFTRADPFSLSLWVRTPVHAPRLVVVHHSKAPVDAGSRGYELLLEEGKVAFGLHHMWPRNSLKVTSKTRVTTNEWTHLAVTYDGSSRAAGVTIFINGEVAEHDIVRDGLFKDITYGGGEPDLTIGFRFRDSGFKDGSVDEFCVYDRALAPLEVAELAGHPAKTPDELLTTEQRSRWFEYYVANEDPSSSRLRKELRDLRRAQAKLIESIPEAMVMEEMATSKPAYILKRGAYDSPGEKVNADTPKALPPFPADAPRSRLGLAQWLLDPGHPLMARVTVNRAWQMMFGRGIVETSDNFGTQGAQPTHQELLDWLACEFVSPVGSNSAAPWDMKRLLKLMALSATYQQSSKAPATAVARDPQNELLARGPAARLSAEMLRDQALALSGLLVNKIGGPSVKPYQPDGLWDIAMGKPRYDRGKGDDLYRRSLYTFWKRTVPPPAMMTFDAADRSYCAARRQRTSTPLQALALLNDVQIVEAARVLGQKMLKEGGSDLDEQIAWIGRATMGRDVTAREKRVLKQLYSEQQEIFSADIAAAEKLLRAGETKSDASEPAAMAAATILAQTLLNHDGVVWKR